MRAELVKTEKAVGMVLCHDITCIEPGRFKGAAFKKGHRVTAEDIPLLLRLGKEHLYTLILDGDEVHEDDAGRRLAAAIAGPGVKVQGPSEGRVNLFAAYQGLLKVNVELLQQLNALPDIVIATLHSNVPVKTDTTLAGTKVIPLVVKEEVLQQVEEKCRLAGPVVQVLPYRKLRLGVLITGREIYEGRIKDAFGPVMKQKAEQFGLEQPEILYAPDDAQFIARQLKQLVENGNELIVLTGGMSVDPDDVTPKGIKLSGAEVVKYGAPVLPGAMFMIAYLRQIPIVGLPACGMFFRTTVFDLILPRLLAGEKITESDISSLGYGGLCRRCEVCLYPDCSFGKSI